MMPFRITVTQLRIGLLILSLLLATGIFAYGSYSYYRLTSPPEIPILDPAKYRAQIGEAQIQRTLSATKLQGVASMLQPSEPAPAPEPKSEEKPAGEEKAKEEILPGDLAEGPLGEQGYQYVRYIRIKDDPRDVLVVLEKRQDAQQPGGRPPVPGAGRPGYTLPSRGTPAPRPQTGIVRPGGRQTAPGDRLVFRVGDRRFRNPELNLDFWIHEANEERFVYWVPGPDGKKSGPFYALKYVAPPGYLREPEKGLRPTPQPELAAAGAAGEQAAAEKPPGFYAYSRDWDPEREREEEYQKLLQGQPEGRVFSAEKTGYKPAGGGAEGAQAPPSSGVPTPKVTPAPSGSGGDRRPPTEEEMRKLKETMEKLPPEARAEMEKALRGPGTRAKRS